MSPRISPKQQRSEPAIATVYEQAPEPYWRVPPDVEVGEEQRERAYLKRLETSSVGSPYKAGGQFSFFGDLLTLARARRRTDGTAEQPRYRHGDPGPGPETPFGASSVQAAQQRLATVQRPKRDITSGGTPPFTAPALPNYLLTIWGRASAQVSALLDAFERRPLERSMVDVSGGVPVVKVPRLSGGPAVAVQPPPLNPPARHLPRRPP